ncbi:hypothetical protein [Deferrisoma camini]|uniref:hypothetical protein n=1 Tax=Deferrisoma camini TaxID=1035120 RepID=UPI00046D7F51|nr:hypothetical protein [Deferrisoma camini]
MKRWMAVGLLVLLGWPAGWTPAGEPAVGRLGPGRLTGTLEEVRLQARAAGLSQDRIRQAEQACEDAGFSSSETARVLLLLARARVAGLPDRDLLSKLREGVAKRAGADAILRALDRRTLTLRRAADLVDRLTLEGFPPADRLTAVEMVADALWAGAETSRILRSVREDRPLGGGLPDVRIAFRRSKRPR